MTVETDLALIGYYDQMLPRIEYFIDHCAKQHEPNALCRLRTMPGIGYILALAILYEVGDISRFKTVQDFCSYARLDRLEKESDGKCLVQTRILYALTLVTEDRSQNELVVCQET